MLKIVSITAAAVLSAGSANAAQFEAHIPYGDLDLSTRHGAAAFDARVKGAADRFCRSVRSIERPVCRNSFRQEALSLLPDHRRAEYARGRFAFYA